MFSKIPDFDKDVARVMVTFHNKKLTFDRIDGLIKNKVTKYTYFKNKYLNINFCVV